MIFPAWTTLKFRPAPLLLREATISISNPARLPLGGYTERGSKKDLPGGDRLYARVICLEQGEKRLVIESAEMLTIPSSLRDAVQAELPKNVCLILCATHTHSAPDSQMLNKRMTFKIPGIATFDRVQFEWYTDKLAKAALKALRAPAMTIDKVETESWQAPCNRGRRKFAIPDKTACWIRFFTANHQSTGIFWYSAHATFYEAKEMQTRGDWPGKVTQLAYLALIGPIGDVSPVAPRLGSLPQLDNAPAAQKIARFWKAMLLPLKEDKARRETVWKQGSPGLDYIRQPIALGKPIANPNFSKTYKIPDSLAQMLVNKFAPEEGFISGFRIGSLAIVGVPGEPSSQLGRDIESDGYRDGFHIVLALSHCNGWIGYLLLPKDYDRGGYEANLNFYGRDGGVRVEKAGELALKKLESSPKIMKQK